MLYCPPNLAFKDDAAMQDFIEQEPFGCLVSYPFFCSYLPWQLKRQEGDKGVLYGHLARHNPQLRQLAEQPAAQSTVQQVLITFTGPHAYISPRYYAAAKAVPTWNYAVVQVIGQVQLLDATDTLWAVQEQLLQYETSAVLRAEKMPAAYLQQLAASIVGVKVTISELAGKVKLGQQRSQADQQGVFAALSQSGRYSERALAQWMAQQAIGTGA